MKFFDPKVWALGMALFAAVTVAEATEPPPFEVVGWPIPHLDQVAPELMLGDDPVTGRLLCPALSRLNLTTQKSEGLLAKRLSEEDASTGKLWKIELRPGIFWWNGEPVTAQTVVSYVENSLKALAKVRGAGLWRVPDFEVKVESGQLLVVKWSQVPEFGPFIFNDAPLYRSSHGSDVTKFECAGIYRPVKEAFGLTLKPSVGYKRNTILPDVRVYQEGARPLQKNGKTLAVQLAADVFDPKNGSKSPSCGLPMLVPYATMLVWNAKSGPAEQRQFRKLMTQLIPRSTLITAGGANLGEVVDLPVPPNHPGFNTEIKPMLFDLRRVSDELNQLGYRRKTAASPRTDDSGKPLQLVIQTASKTSGLVEKVIADAFSSVGIGTRFKDVLDSGEVPDGYLAVFGEDWPRVSFLGNFHSKAKDTSPFWSLSDTKLDKLLESYALSLTREVPDFKLLAQVQSYLSDLSPVTVLVQHKACIKPGAEVKITKTPNQANPDWFRQLLY